MNTRAGKTKSPGHQASTHEGGDRAASRTRAASRNVNSIVGLQHHAGNQALTQILSDKTKGGQPLESTTRRRMESSFGEDFSSVRLQTGPEAEQSARAVNAAAYTTGENIVLGTPAPDTDSAQGHRLLAHELAHVVQQRRAGQSPSGMISSGWDDYEAEADHAVALVDAGRCVTLAASGNPPQVQRLPLGDKDKVQPGGGKGRRDVLGELEQIRDQLLAALPEKSRETIRGYRTIAIARVRRKGTKLKRLVYTMSHNQDVPGLEEAAKQLGLDREKPVPRAEGRGEVGAPEDAEQLLQEHAMEADEEILGMVTTRTPCKDCGPSVQGEGIPLAGPRKPLRGSRRGQKSAAPKPAPQKGPKPAEQDPESPVSTGSGTGERIPERKSLSKAQDPTPPAGSEQAKSLAEAKFETKVQKPKSTPQKLSPLPPTPKRLMEPSALSTAKAEGLGGGVQLGYSALVKLRTEAVDIETEQRLEAFSDKIRKWRKKGQWVLVYKYTIQNRTPEFGTEAGVFTEPGQIPRFGYLEFRKGSSQDEAQRDPLPEFSHSSTEKFDIETYHYVRDRDPIAVYQPIAQASEYEEEFDLPPALKQSRGMNGLYRVASISELSGEDRELQEAKKHLLHRSLRLSVAEKNVEIEMAGNGGEYAYETKVTKWDPVKGLIEAFFISDADRYVIVSSIYHQGGERDQLLDTFQTYIGSARSASGSLTWVKV